MKVFSKKLVAIGMVVGVTALAGLAFALWSATATGSAKAKALNAQTVTVTAVTGAADLYPGFTGGDLHFTLNNTNPYPVTFTSMTGGTVSSDNAAACPASNITVANATGLSVTVAGNTESSALSIPSVVTMATAAPDGCQGVGFTVALTLSGTQG